MGKKMYAGLNVQYPISELILSGKKTIETRTYPIPEKYLGVEMVLIETPGKSGKFKSRMRGLIVFEGCFEYQNKSEFYRDTSKHCVTPDSDWKWNAGKPKWGWKVKVVKLFKKPKPLKKRTGIKYSTGLEV